MKRLIITLFLLAGLLGLCSGKEIVGYKQADQREDLVKWYDGYNEEYFLNQLPSARVEWGEMGNMGVTYEEAGGPLIVISEKYHPSFKEAQMTLLHEMCHVKLRNDHYFDIHGPPFQQCMHDLANQGAFDDLW
jgi:hypothetical protein